MFFVFFEHGEKNMTMMRRYFLKYLYDISKYEEYMGSKMYWID
jgi:hypothetical protein